MTEYVLTAQPINDDGTIGFDDRNPIEASGPTLAGVFSIMAQAIANELSTRSAWDLTLQTREVRCPGCGKPENLCVPSCGARRAGVWER